MIDANARLEEGILEGIVDNKAIPFNFPARGEGRKDSDVDLLVIKSCANHRRSLAQRAYQALRGVGVPVDVVVVTPEDIERYRYKTGTIIAPAIAEGRVLHGASS